MAKYTKQTWTDGVSSASAARMGVLETGIFDATFGRSATFPTSPVDGQLHQYPADATNGIMWLFVYNSGSGSSYKWEFIGGHPLYAEITTVEGTSSATFAALATAGPSITVPLAGDYEVALGSRCENASAASGIHSYDIGGTGAVDADGMIAAVINAVGPSGSRVRRKTGLAASTALVSKYRTTAGTANFSARWLRVTPIRVSG